MRLHIVDTFADERFAGNPAAVVPAPVFPPVDLMQGMASVADLPTAFVVPAGQGEYRVRWFTSHREIDQCVHATIASARHLFGQPADADRSRLTFVSDNGTLYAERVGDLIAIDLPTARLTPAEPPPGLLDALGTGAVACALSSDDTLVEVESAEAVAAVRPDLAALRRQPFRGHIVTARATSGADFVSRTFYPHLGVNEDQVCVTAHCKLAPYWSARLNRRRLTALQLAGRGVRLEVVDDGDWVRTFCTAVPRDPLRPPAPEGSARAEPGHRPEPSRAAGRGSMGSIRCGCCWPAAPSAAPTSSA